MSFKKRLLVSLAVVFVVIQFIQPAHNKSVQVLPGDFIAVYKPPLQIQSLFLHACYDCHSNNTNYPWYSNIQPVAWIMARHVRIGKEKLNFSTFDSNSSRKQISKLKETLNHVKDNEMPIISYKLMHIRSRLEENEKTLLIHWLQITADSLSANN